MNRGASGPVLPRQRQQEKERQNQRVTKSYPHRNRCTTLSRGGSDLDEIGGLRLGGNQHAIAQASTTVSTAVTQAYETVFSVPDSLQLQKGDLGFGISVLQKVNQAQIVDPGLEADLMQFFKECTVYDIQDGAINPQTIMSGTDPFNTVFTQTSPARYVTTNTLTANPTTDTCLATGTLLLIRVTDAEQKAEQMYGKEMYPQVTDASAAKARSSMRSATRTASSCSRRRTPRQRCARPCSTTSGARLVPICRRCSMTPPGLRR